MRGLVLAALFYSASVLAAPAELNPWWITVGGFSEHFDRQDRLNQTHQGLGVEYSFAPDWAAIAGTFKNSTYEWSQYAGVNWLPIEYSVFKLGLTAQISNHYRNLNNGAVFAFAAPMLSAQYEHFGANIYLIPSLANVTGAVVLQFKVSW
jgi:hypothetical protein